MFTIDGNRKTVKPYDESRFFEFRPEDESYDPLTSLLAALLPRLKIRSTSLTSKRTVKIRRAARPDLASLDAFGDDQFWWILMEYNGVKSFADLKVDDVLKIPDPSELNTLVLSLPLKDNFFI